MKIPVRDERFNPATGQMEMMDIDIAAELRQEAIAVFSMVTQCESNVELSPPNKMRTVAGFDHYCVEGEFSSGDAYGKITFGWTVKTEDPKYYDVMRITLNIGNNGWCDIDWRSNDVFLERVTNEYRLFLEAQKFVPKKYGEIEELLRQLRVLPMPDKYHDQVVKLADEISALLGNAMSKKEQIATYGKELKK
jgi:hypothetical protein